MERNLASVSVGQPSYGIGNTSVVYSEIYYNKQVEIIFNQQILFDENESFRRRSEISNRLSGYGSYSKIN